MSAAPEERENLETLERQVYHYRMAGESLADIAERFGITLYLTTKLHRQYAKKLAMIAAEDSDIAKAMELDRIDALMAAHWDYATNSYSQEVVVGSGPTAHVETIQMPPDAKAAAVVLNAMKERAKLRGWDQAQPIDQATVNNILIVGNNQKDFLEALQAGQKRLDSADPDNVIEGQIEEETR